ncbi:DNA repair protein RadC [Flavihumibacter cheonanensis]|jgi:DNA repair protein RadC|uniref:RadC family protein n=1 Tax=Flavihumibacter cheonanensis TaxID=1442385 RepID=UPI001EF7C492|nr:DNA repair protein RadC [Flavihumibacter cheonanensis]MCG7752420.1 DNA repair protein RadC [Flavihumibacter cheonanensis]
MQAQNHSIKSWAKDDRPREKLLSKSPMQLSDAELIALLLNHGNKEKTALDMARELLQLGQNNLFELGKLSVFELMKVKGIGKAKAVTIAAAMELAKRRQLSQAVELKAITGSRDVAAFLQQQFGDYRHEIFIVLFLNRANKIKHKEIISSGGLTGTVADPRIIMRKAIEQDAVALILCHNHPSGNLHPSKADEELTRKIREAALLLDIRVLDHLIVSQDGYFSFADEGLI